MLFGEAGIGEDGANAEGTGFMGRFGFGAGAPGKAKVGGEDAVSTCFPAFCVRPRNASKWVCAH